MTPLSLPSNREILNIFLNFFFVCKEGAGIDRLLFLRRVLFFLYLYKYIGTTANFPLRFFMGRWTGQRDLAKCPAKQKHHFAHLP